MKGTTFTSESERVRVRMLLSLVAHTIGYKMMVDAHSTVCVRRMWEVLPYLTCMVDDGAHNTVDDQRHVGGALPCLSGMGVDGAHNTVGKISATTTLLGFWHAWKVVGHPSDMSCQLLSCRRAGYGPRYRGQLECPALLAPSISWSSPSERPRLVDSSRL